MLDAKSYQEMRQEFNKKYQEIILPTVRKYEGEREEYLKKSKKYSKILLVLSLLSVPLLILVLGFFVVFVAVILFVCSTFPKSIMKKSFEAKVKEKIMPVVCSCFGGLKWTNGLSYKPGAAIKISGIVSKYDSYFFDDIFVGSYKNVNYEIIEGTFDYGTGKNSRVFSGVIIKLAMNKEFNSHTIITPELESHKPPIKGLRHTVLEDIDFEKKFDVFTTDEVDARYLITTSFMERLKAMKTAFRATRTKCVFLGKHLLIALDTPKDLFSICSLDKPMDDSQQYKQMYYEIESIIKLIDHFKLDQKIGL